MVEGALAWKGVNSLMIPIFLKEDPEKIGEADLIEG